MSSTMLNFRVKNEFAYALDAAAKANGMTRSDFIRAALSQAVAVSATGNSATAKAPQPAQSQPAQVKPAACKHPREQLVRTPYGIKLCQVCGSRLG